LAFIFGAWFLFKIEKDKFFSVIKNARPERIIFYLTLIVGGGGLAYIMGYGKPFSYLDIFGFICLGLSWISFWMYSVHINDIYDVEIDKISNRERPLVRQEMTLENMQHAGYIWLALALAGSWSAGFYPFFMGLVCLAISYIYSAHPLRLKRFPILSSFIISVACLATVLAGFFFVSAEKRIQIFPISLAIGILLILTLAKNARDIKDIEGDKANGIYTLPILFGKNGIKIVGLCLASGFLLIPIFLKFYELYIVALPAAIIGYMLVIKKPYKEKNIFTLYFAFSIGAVILTYFFLG
jgi:4-hydroxybenzoate polyprenyltransferase